ncbi:MAG: DUF2206 domain-containing protein [Halohasta sp.]
MIVPGALWLTLVGVAPRADLRWLLYSVGTSLLTVMGVGLVLTLVGPFVGLDRPLAPRSLWVAHGTVIVGLALLIRLVDPPGRTLGLPPADWRTEWYSRWLRPTTFALLLVPPLTVLAVRWLNATSDNRPLIAVLVAIAVVPLAIAVGAIGRRWLPLSIASVGLSLLYHDTLWRYSSFSGQANIVDAWRTGRWAITERSAEAAATSPLLPNVTISPTVAHVAGIDIFVQLSVVNPLFVALIPLGSFVLFRRFVDPVEAALGALLVAFIHPFYYQLPWGGRAATPVVFLVLTAVALTDRETHPPVAQGLAVAFVAALVTTHYGASYFVMVALVVALAVVIGLQLLDGLLADSVDDATVAGRIESLRMAIKGRSRRLSVGFVGFYIALTFGWYGATFGGQKVRSFFSRVRRSLLTVLDTGGGGGGGSAARLTREYGAASIQLSRILYVLLALLSAIGVASLFVGRYRGNRERDGGFDEFVALGVGLLAVFSLTFVLGSLWGGGRPMAIAFSVTALFAVVGVAALVGLARGAVDRLRGVLSGRSTGGSQDRSTNVRAAAVGFACLLTALLLLNSGVAAATALGGAAPSSVPLQPAIEAEADESPGAHSTLHADQDVAMLVWLNSHADGETDVYADEITRQRNNDIYQPQIAAHVDPADRRAFRVMPDLFAVIDTRDEAYVVLPSYSVNLGVAETPEGGQYTGSRSYQDLDAVDARLDGELKLYTNGDSEVYRTVERPDDETDR